MLNGINYLLKWIDIQQDPDEYPPGALERSWFLFEWTQADRSGIVIVHTRYIFG